MRHASAERPDLDGRVSIVTGAGGGIGGGVARTLAAAGASVVVNDVDAKNADATVADIRKAGGRAVSCVVGVGDQSAGEKLVDTAVKEFGGIHILINVAGVYAPMPITEMTGEAWERVIRVHLFGAFWNIKAAVGPMIAQRYGRIVNTVSRAGLRGYPPGECNYSAAKTGIAGMSLALAYELLPHTITVNCVSPVAWTSTAEALPPADKQASWDFRARGVLGRPGMPEDVAQTYLFLASDRAAYLTGQIIQATGEPMHLV